MIDPHDRSIPNGRTMTLVPEAARFEYHIMPVNTGIGEPSAPDLLATTPGARMPAIVDHDPVDGGDPGVDSADGPP